jgi:hypothetical protein
MKRYLVFSSACYYPGGGWEDFVGAYDTADEAFKVARDREDDYSWSQVVDLEAMKEIVAASAD